MDYEVYKLRNGQSVLSKDGSRPVTYANRTQAERAAAKIPGAEVIVRGRPFYVLVPVCEKCKGAEDVEVVEVLEERNPDVYGEKFICSSCQGRARFQAENEGYLRAVAGGWND